MRIAVILGMAWGCSGVRLDDSACTGTCIGVSYGVDADKPPGPMGTNGLHTTSPNSRISVAPATSGMPGWEDIPASSLFLHRLYLGIQVTVPSYTVAANTEIVFRCASDHLDKQGDYACDLFFFMYKCSPCKISFGSHRISHALQAENWLPLSCGGSFQLHPAGHFHRLAVWHKELAKHDTTTVLSPNLSNFLFWGITQKSVLCSVKDQLACLEASPDCFWDDENSICRTDVCGAPVKWKGPVAPNSCPVCITDEASAHVPEFSTQP